MGYRYYSIALPVSLGTFPEPEDNPIVAMTNFNCKRNVSWIGREACGWVEYEKPLPTEAAEEYELVAKFSKEDLTKAKICEQLCKTLQLTRNRADLVSLTYDPAKELVIAKFQHGERTINVACDSELAMIRDIITWI